MVAADEMARAESRLVQAARTGTLVDLRGESSAVIPAELLVRLLTETAKSEIGPLRAIKVRGAHITGELDLEYMTLRCPLLLWGCDIEEPIVLSDATAPSIRLPGCQVAEFIADQLHTIGNLELNKDFTTDGEFRLTGARIGGRLDLSNSVLQGIDTDGRALAAEGLTVDQSLLAREALVAGELCLVGAHVAGRLDLSEANFTNPDGVAINADSITVGQDMLCEKGFTAVGEIRLRSANVAGDLSFSDAQLHNPDGMVLHADSLTVGQSMFCHREFTALGEICLLRATIRGALSFRSAILAAEDGPTLTLRQLNAAVLYLVPRQPPKGEVDLSYARVGAFHDQQETWPNVLNLRGFAYETLENQDVPVRDRLRWLRRDPGGYLPHVYDQLATAYRRAGHEEAARRVGMAKQWRRRSPLNPLNWLLYATVGYGYRTWLAAVWLAVLAAVGTWVFSSAYPAHMIAAKAHPAAFHPLAYTLDVLLPIVDLGQQNSWQPQGSALYWSWALIGAGWLLTTAVVAGLSGVLKRD